MRDNKAITCPTCPTCGSEHTNKVSKTNNYCFDCLQEFNVKSSKVFSIEYFNGDLVEPVINEFSDIA